MVYFKTVSIAVLLTATVFAFKYSSQPQGNKIPEMHGKWVATDDGNMALFFLNEKQVYHFYKNVATDTFDYRLSEQACDTTLHDTAHNIFLLETNRQDTLCFQVSFYKKDNAQFMTLLRGTDIFTYRKNKLDPKHYTRY